MRPCCTVRDLDLRRDKSCHAPSDAPRRPTASPWLPASGRPYQPLVRQGLQEANCEGIETKIRKRRLFFAGAITPSDDASAASRLWGNLGSGGQLKDRHRCLVADLVAFQSTEGSTEHFQLQFGVKAVLLVHAASMAGKWYRGALEAAERFMARWHEEKA